MSFLRTLVAQGTLGKPYDFLVFLDLWGIFWIWGQILRFLVEKTIRICKKIWRLLHLDRLCHRSEGMLSCLRSGKCIQQTKRQSCHRQRIEQIISSTMFGPLRAVSRPLSATGRRSKSALHSPSSDACCPRRQARSIGIKYTQFWSKNEIPLPAWQRQDRPSEP